MDSSIESALAERVTELVGARTPFVRATVVRVQPPASARAGDQAIILADGTMDGFVGGQCTRESVRAAAVGVLERGESLLLRVLPDGAGTFPETTGAEVVVNPCLSGGAVEVFLEPVAPSPVVSVVGETPVADATAELARWLGFAVQRDADAVPPTETLAVILAGQGGAEPAAIRTALDAGVGFVGLVASRRRGAAVLDEIDLTDGERSRVHTPVGIDVGGQGPQEIALSIMSAVVRALRVDGLEPSSPPATSCTAGAAARAVQDVAVGARVATDPVCGMRVVIGEDTPHLVVDGADQWFCGPGCRDSYAAKAG